MAKVLVIGTSRKTRGGITSVIKAHETGEQWEKYNCEWIETHIDGTALQKIGYFLSGMIKFIFKIHKADIVHIHLAAVERKMPFIFISRLFKKKIIVHFHFPDPATTIDNPDKAWKYGWCVKKADVVIALSKTWQRVLEQRYDAHNICVLYNPCPSVDSLSDFSDKLKGDKYILYAGNLSERKGYIDLLKAFSEVHYQIPQWRLKFAGNGEINEAEEISDNLGIGNKVDFLGWVAGSEKEKAFRGACCYCLPSYAEGFPMGVLDAWAYGLPVITTPVGGLPDIIKHKENALVFNPGNIDELKGCLSMLDDKNLMVKLTDASIKLANETFNIKTITGQLGNIYESLLTE